MLCKDLKNFFIFLILIISYPHNAFPQQTHHRLKFVFPFGEGIGTTSICQPQYQTNNGCCEPPKDIYEYSTGAKGCCTAPNEVLGAIPNERCCTPWKAGQNRWGQTASSPCGGYCGTPDVISSYNGYSSCCSNCGDVNGVLAFQTITSVCGTCCSRIPISCGNIGERVCEPGTGSAYCSQTSACNHPNEWSYGSEGEGGFTCCTSCEGTRYGHGTSSCGSCCLSPNVIRSYSGVFSCCPHCPNGIEPTGQTQTNVCGSCCSAYTWSASTYCCYGDTSYVTAPGATYGACCSSNNSPYRQGEGTRCCMSGSIAQTLPGTSFGACCSPGVAPYKIGDYTGCCGGEGFSATSAPNATYETCCNAGETAVRTAHVALMCCPTGTFPYGSEDLDIVFGACCSTNASGYRVAGNAECCPAGSSVVRASNTLYEGCCPAGVSAYKDGLRTSCCSSGKIGVLAHGAFRGTCCNPGSSYYLHGQQTICGSMSCNLPTYSLYEEGNICCHNTSVYGKAVGAQTGMCCSSGEGFYRNYQDQTMCCSVGSSVITLGGKTYNDGCCPAGHSAYIVGKMDHSYDYVGCCSVAGHVPHYVHRDAPNGAPYGIGGCCPAGVEFVADGLFGKCCQSGEKAVYANSTWFGECCPSGNEYYNIGGTTRCCPSGYTRQSLPGTVNERCCAPGEKPYRAGGGTACCSTGYSILSVPGTDDGACCSDGQTAILAEGYPVCVDP